MLLPEPIPGFDTHFTPMPFVTVSTLRTFKRCPRKYFYEYGANLGPPEGPHPALKFGEAIHKALGILATSDDLAQALEGFRDVWQDRDGLGDDRRNTAQAIKILMEYTQNHSGGKSLYKLVKPPTTGGLVMVDDQTSDYEVPFALDLGLELPFCGRIDALVQHRDSGEYWGLEWKTTSEMSPRFLEGFTLNSQVIGYTTALRALWPDLKIRGFMVEALATLKTRQDNMLIPIYVQDHLCDDFISWAKWRTTEIQEMTKLKNFPKDFAGCNPYDQFGMPGYTCQYTRLCQSEDWQGLVGTYSKREQYSPFVQIGETNV